MLALVRPPFARGELPPSPHFPYPGGGFWTGDVYRIESPHGVWIRSCGTQTQPRENNPMTDENCGRTNRHGDPCELPAGWGTDDDSGACKFHGGKAGAPEGNKNALKSGIGSNDPTGLLDFLARRNPEALDWIDRQLQYYARIAPEAVYAVESHPTVEGSEIRERLTGYGWQVLQVALKEYTIYRAQKRQLAEGMVTERTKASGGQAVTVEGENPVNLPIERADKTLIRKKKELGLLPESPDARQADAVSDLGKAMREAFEE